jgi:cellulose synthase/poly-beta-1,6-N-acetylglucosamine synthase-like glycosyltransferase
MIAYTYVGFPVLVLLRALVRPRPHLSAPVTPYVSVIIAAHNEADSITAKVENVLGLDYPHELLELIVASDGSDDGTDAIAAAYADQGVRLISLPRVGKAAALDAAVAAAVGDILVFSDANSLYAPNAVRALVAPFADPTVGGVAGDQRYIPDDFPESKRAAGERGYWAIDRHLKVAESRAGNAISATGAIYAIRRTLFRGVPPGVTDDFVTSTSVIAQGYRLVFAPNAIAWEPVAASGPLEFARKVRIMTRGLRAVFEQRQLLNPRRHGFYALQVVSHKVLRRLMAVPLLILAITSALLWSRGPIYRIMTILQGIFYGCGAVGVLAERTTLGRWRVFSVPAFFCLVNAASLAAVVNLARGHRIDRWEPQRVRNADQHGEAAPEGGSGLIATEASQ